MSFQQLKNEDHLTLTFWERWVFRTIVGILIALVGWLGVRAVDAQGSTTSAVATLSVQMAVMQNQISAISTQVTDTNTLTRQVAVLQEEVQDHERRIELLEDRTTRPKR